MCIFFFYFLNYRIANCIKKRSVEIFICLKFYHDKRSKEQQEITIYPVADIFPVRFDSLNVLKCISEHYTR